MFKNKIKVVILRHPQEQDVKLGTANLIADNLENAKIVSGLSWKNFDSVLGYKEDPKKWAVLYLGSFKIPEDRILSFIDKKNNLIVDDKDIKKNVVGILVLDGTWSQAKSLWWRNPWLLKLNRIAIKPFMPSLYGKLREEPRKESVSSLEALATALVEFGEPVEVSKILIKEFRKMLEIYRTSKK